MIELRSPRLLLRQLRREDLAALCAYRSLPEVARYQDWEFFGPDAAARLIDGQSGLEPNVPGTWLQLALVLLRSGEVVGDCGIHFREDDPRQVELGITLAPDHQGHGLAAEALGSVLQYVFGSLGKHRASAVTDAENHAAAGLFRRLGFRQEAHFVEHVWFKGAWGSEYVFGMPEPTPKTGWYSTNRYCRHKSFAEGVLLNSLALRRKPGIIGEFVRGRRGVPRWSRLFLSPPKL